MSEVYATKNSGLSLPRVLHLVLSKLWGYFFKRNPTKQALVWMSFLPLLATELALSFVYKTYDRHMPCMSLWLCRQEPAIFILNYVTDRHKSYYDRQKSVSKIWLLIGKGLDRHLRDRRKSVGKSLIGACLIGECLETFSKARVETLGFRK